jgi:DNA-binding NarL/FixJ family response regulator
MSTAPLPIRVLVSDGTEIGCELLSSALDHQDQFAFEILGTAVTSSALVEVALEREPDVVLVSVALQDGLTAGLLALRELHTRAPAIRCILLLDKPDPVAVVEAFRRGVRGVFQRSSSLQLLRRCIQVVHEGQVWISSADLSHLLETFSTAIPLTFSNANGQELLSKREREIVALVMQGLGNREIARQAHLSEHTVKNYLMRIFDKLGVASRAELIIYALNRRDSR